MAHQLAPPVTAAQPYMPHPAFSACYAGHTLPSHGLPRRPRLSLALARSAPRPPWPRPRCGRPVARGAGGARLGPWQRVDLAARARPWRRWRGCGYGDYSRYEGLSLDGGGGALGLGLRAGAVALGEDAGRRERLHEAAHHSIARALRRRPDAERREQRLRGLGARAAAGAASADPSGGAGGSLGGGRWGGSHGDGVGGVLGHGCG
ncbi:LOW QUALITY PROTEIN: hypothetical protein BDA96_10G186000 [Sorghum bicolor]|uniref:Uncharacterized protein n=1 Tax=Sorghum bicolor TaxID=4558 RepID=A0A921U1E3_SORBI|nr:LOW QUALITY PROTEIN: hypothetical protein BDA96_10G186000 [Sorghum bicolor]